MSWASQPALNNFATATTQVTAIVEQLTKQGNKKKGRLVIQVPK